MSGLLFGKLYKKRYYIGISTWHKNYILNIIFFRSFDGEQLNGERLRLGFARPAPSKCVWCCGLPTKRDLSASVGSDVVVKAVQGEFGRFGKIQDVLYDEERGHALVYYDQVG